MYFSCPIFLGKQQHTCIQLYVYSQSQKSTYELTPFIRKWNGVIPCCSVYAGVEFLIKIFVCRILSVSLTALSVQIKL